MKLVFFLRMRQPPRSPLFPYTALFRSAVRSAELHPGFTADLYSAFYPLAIASPVLRSLELDRQGLRWSRSEEHTSELQSRQYLVCRLLLENKKPNRILSTAQSPLLLAC